MDAAKRETYLYGFKNATVKEVDGEIAGFFFGYDGGVEDEEYEPLDSILEEYDLPTFEIDWSVNTFLNKFYKVYNSSSAFSFCLPHPNEGPSFIYQSACVI